MVPGGAQDVAGPPQGQEGLQLAPVEVLGGDDFVGEVGVLLALVAVAIEFGIAGPA
jgi:hypothetical protein